MDLRGRPLPADFTARLQHDRDEAVMWYQPFIFRDDLVTGTGAFWNGKGAATSYISTPNDPAPIRELFLKENLILSAWYDHLADMIADCFPKARTTLDLGCNAGRLSFALAQRGKHPTGVDVWSRCYQTVSEVSGLSFEYVTGAYDSATHRVAELEGRTFDVSMAIAVSTHLTDPHYFLRYLTDTARQAVVVATPTIHAADNEAIWRVRVPNWRQGRSLPELIEFLPSTCAMELMLQNVFPYVYRRAHRDTDPVNIRHSWALWTASAAPIPAAMLKRHNLTHVPARLASVADAPMPFEAMPIVTPETAVELATA